MTPSKSTGKGVKFGKTEGGSFKFAFEKRKKLTEEGKQETI